MRAVSPSERTRRFFQPNFFKYTSALPTRCNLEIVISSP